MLELEDAVERILTAVPKPIGERVPLTDAFRRFSAQPIPSPVDLPGFDNSSVDGYAVRASDVAAAQSGAPVRLRLIGRVEAGGMFEGEVIAGTSVRLFTGSPLPRGADAVVMQEDTERAADPSDEVSILDAV